MGLNVGANFPGYVMEMGALRSRTGLLAATIIPGVTVGAGAGAVSYFSTPKGERDSGTVMRSIGIGAAAGVGAALIGLATHRFAGAGPEIGTVAGRTSYLVGTGRYEQVWVTRPVYDNLGHQTGTVQVREMREIMETRWTNTTGNMYLNKRFGNHEGYSSVDDAKAALGERNRTVGLHLNDGRVYLFNVKGRGPEVITDFRPTDSRVVIDRA